MKNTLLILFALTFLIACKSNLEKEGQQEPNGQRPTPEQLMSELNSNIDGKE